MCYMFLLIGINFDTSLLVLYLWLFNFTNLGFVNLGPQIYLHCRIVVVVGFGRCKPNEKQKFIHTLSKNFSGKTIQQIFYLKLFYLLLNQQIFSLQIFYLLLNQ